MPSTTDNTPVRILLGGSAGVGRRSLAERLAPRAGALPDPDDRLKLPIEALAASRAWRSLRPSVRIELAQDDSTCALLAAAAGADAILIVIDAAAGVTAHARWLAHLAAVMGVRHALLAVNKMDLCDFDAAVFRHIAESFAQFAGRLGFESLQALPVSALRGDNLATPSAQMPWYDGQTLLDRLEAVGTSPSARLVFAVESEAAAEARTLTGSLIEGEIRVGDEVKLVATGQQAGVVGVVRIAGQRAQLSLDKPLAAHPGDVLSLAASPWEMTDQFEANLVWLDPDPGLAGRTYELRLASQSTSAAITAIKYRMQTDSLQHEAARTLARDDLGVCNLALGKQLVFAAHADSRALGSFVLTDRDTHAPVAAGTIRHSLRRAQNVHRQALSIKRRDREELNGHPGRVVWFTGLSGSGKSTIANALEVMLHEQGYRTYLLDGDNVRQGLNKDLGFADADRVENIRRITEVAKLMLDAGLIVMTAFISPFRRERDMARQIIGAENFVEVYLSTPLAVCEARDPKGLYRKARSGQLPNMSGIDSPYEPPEAAEVVVASDLDVRAAAEEILRALGAGDV